MKKEVIICDNCAKIIEGKNKKNFGRIFLVFADFSEVNLRGDYCCVACFKNHVNKLANSMNPVIEQT